MDAGQSKWNLMSPAPAAPAAPEPEDVVERKGGRRVGFLSNRKPNATEMEQEFARLAEDAGLTAVTHFYEKVEGPGVGATKELLDQIAEECDVVMVGSADCGSCTSWSTHDAVGLETRGAYALLLCSEAFEQLAKVQSASLGRPELELLKVPHPISGSTPDVAVAKAKDAFPRFQEWLEKVASPQAQAVGSGL